MGAAVQLRVGAYHTRGKRSYLQLTEKGGLDHLVPTHHRAQEYLDDYLTDAGIGDDRDGPLFRACARIRSERQLVREPMSRLAALDMIRRQAGLSDRLSPHSFRATGITEYLRNGGQLETAAQIAGAREHAHYAAL